MLLKLIVVIMVVGATASALLVNRQQRIETFHEMSLIHHRLIDHESTLWQMRAQIAERCRPTEVRSAMTRIGGEWKPIPARPVRPNLTNPTADMRVVNADGTDAADPPAKSNKSAVAKKKASSQPVRTALAPPRRPRPNESLGG